MSEDLISIPDIARLHARHKSVVHKVVRRHGIETHLLRSGSETHGQRVLYIRRGDYERIVAELARLDKADEGDTETESEVEATSGVFYVVLLEPTLDPGRFKVGFATSIDERLRKHRTSAPFATVVKAWPCKLLWEKTAIDCVTVGCERLHTEVFRSDDVAAVVARADAFFGMMPTP